VRRYIEWVIRLRVVVLALTLLITAALAAQVRNLEVIMDTTKLVPSNHPYVVATTDIERIFGLKFMIAIAITPHQGDAFAPGVVGKVERITAAIRDMPGVSKRTVLSFAARRAKGIAGTSEGIEVRPLTEHVPNGAANSAELRRAVYANPVYLNAIVSRD
jgi:predicted RND superfamily exporter protein